MKHMKVTLSGACFAGFLMAAATPASAIECEGNFQVQRSGNLIATPYCEDQYLAEVAQEYGKDVSGADIRGSFGLKRETCRLVGNDNRVRNTCAQFLNKRRDGRCGPFPC